MSFFEQMITAIYKFQSYPALMMNGKGRVIRYFLAFTLLTVIISFIPFGIKYLKMGGIEEMSLRYIPDFTLENGRLECEYLDYENADIGLKVYINTNETLSENNAGGYMYYILADSTHMFVGNGVQNTSISFEDIDGSLSGEQVREILNSLSFKTMFTTIFMLSLIVSILIGTAFNLVILAFLGNLINIIFVKAQIKFGKLVVLAVYARTFPTLLSLVIGLAGLSYSSFITWGLIITYMYIGLKNYKKGSGIILAEI